MKYSLPDLEYSYDALEPYVSTAVMKLHHTKHHQAYIDKLNAALVAQPELDAVPLVALLAQTNLPSGIRNNGGGHYNHSQFWRWMSPDGGGQPHGTLQDALNMRYGSFQAFVDIFSAEASALFGSGWIWLTNDLQIVATPNQDTTMRLGFGEPLLGLDVWEHAYYLDYKNARSEYIQQWWNIVNWDRIAEDYSRNRIKNKNSLDE